MAVKNPNFVFKCQHSLLPVRTLKHSFNVSLSRATTDTHTQASAAVDTADVYRGFTLKIRQDINQTNLPGLHFGQKDYRLHWMLMKGRDTSNVVDGLKHLFLTSLQWVV